MTEKEFCDALAAHLAGGPGMHATAIDWAKLLDLVKMIPLDKLIQFLPILISIFAKTP